MRKQHLSDRSYTQQDRHESLYVLRLSGFWGKVAAGAMLLLLVPLMATFFLLLVSGLIAMAVVGIVYAWWHMRKLRRVRPPEEGETIELAASEYHALEEPSRKKYSAEKDR